MSSQEQTNESNTNSSDISYIAKFWGESFYSIPRSFKKKMRTLLKTTIIICEELFEYFSSETGRFKARKVLSIDDIKKITGFSKSAILKSIDEIENNDIFLVHREGTGKDKTFGFYVRNIKNIELFEKIKEGKINLKLNIKKDFLEIINNITDINLEKIDHKKNQIDHKKNQDQNKKNQNDEIKNEIDHKKNQSEVDQTVVNTDTLPLENSSQESLIKETILKKPLTLEEKIIESEKRLKGFLKSDEIKIKEEKEIMKDNSTLENEKQLDRIKSILIGQFGFYESLVENFLKTKSIKCLDECIQLTIEAEENGSIKSNTRTYFKNKIEFWVEKKEPIVKSSYSSEIIVPKILNGEKAIIDFCFNKRFIFGGNKNLKNAVIELLKWFDGKKDLMNDFKKLNLSMEEIKAIFTELEKDQSFWQNSSFNKKQAFLNAFSDPNFSISEEKINYIPTKGELDNMMYKALEGKILPSIGNPFAQKKVILEDKKDNGWCGFGSKVTFSEKTTIESKESKKDNSDDEEIPM